MGEEEGDRSHNNNNKNETNNETKTKNNNCASNRRGLTRKNTVHDYSVKAVCVQHSSNSVMKDPHRRTRKHIQPYRSGISQVCTMQLICTKSLLRIIRRQHSSSVSFRKSRNSCDFGDVYAIKLVDSMPQTTNKCAFRIFPHFARRSVARLCLNG